MRITKKKFFEATGYLPEQDDLERSNCKKAGETVHLCCGWCEKHDKPRFMCGCMAPYKSTSGRKVIQTKRDARQPASNEAKPNEHKPVDPASSFESIERLEFAERDDA